MTTITVLLKQLNKASKIMKKFNMDTTGVLIIWSIFALAIIGWVWNIVKLIGELSGPITSMFLARIAGVLMAPLGSVLGFF